MAYVLESNYPGVGKQFDASSKYIIDNVITPQGGTHPKPLVGDIAVWTTHFEIVTAVNGSMMTISVSNGKNNDPIPKRYQLAYGNMEKMNKFSGTKFLGFWTPLIPARSYK